MLQHKHQMYFVDRVELKHRVSKGPKGKRRCGGCFHMFPSDPDLTLRRPERATNQLWPPKLESLSRQRMSYIFWTVLFVSSVSSRSLLDFWIGLGPWIVLEGLGMYKYGLITFADVSSAYQDLLKLISILRTFQC